MSPAPRDHPRRGTAVGILALCVAVLLLAHGLIPNNGGYASLFETFLPWLGVVIFVLMVAALVRRSGFALLCVVAVATVWSILFVPVLLPGSVQSDVALTIASENIHANNAAAAEVVGDLAKHSPDIVAVQELDAASRNAVSTALEPQYPHSQIVGTVGIWSTSPILDWRPLDLGLGWSRALWADIDTPVGVTRVYVVHLASVRPGQYEQRDTMLDRLRETIADDDSKRLVVVGDFNSASTDRAFASLTSEVSEASTSDLGFGFTWPAEFPVARLDHALTRGMTTLTSWVLPDNGSDHRGIVVSLH